MWTLGQESPILRVKRIVSLQSTGNLNTEDRVHKCRYCFKIFGIQRARKRHESTFCILNPQVQQQKKLNSFSCQACGASFTRNAHLKSHQRNDCGKIHKCGNCGRIYADKGGLRRHLRIAKCIVK